MKFAIPLAVFIAVAALLYMGLGGDKSRVPSPFIGKPLPTVDLPELHDPERRFTNARVSERDEVVLLNVWASWCPPCREEHPVFVEIADDVPLYGINYKDARDDAIDWLERLGDPYVAIGYDEDGLAGIELGLYGVPETYVVDGEGKIRYKHVGAVTRTVYEQTLLPIIEQVRREATPQ
ncbi:MAG: DsbE family thiol:disulfide interchange protein [Aquisalimonadaceae bacterium]